MVRVATSRQANKLSPRNPMRKTSDRKSLLARPTTRLSEIPRGSRCAIGKSKTKSSIASSSLLSKVSNNRQKSRSVSTKSVRFEGFCEEPKKEDDKGFGKELTSIENFTDFGKSFSKNSQVADDFIFEEDPESLASILNNEGVSTNLLKKIHEDNAKKEGKTADECLLAGGRPSLCRRIPVNRTSSILPDGSRPSLLSSRVSAGPGRIARPSMTGRPSATGRPSVAGRPSFSSRRGSVIRTAAQDTLFSFIERRYSQRHHDVPMQPPTQPARHSVLLSSAKPNQLISAKDEQKTFKKPDKDIIMSARRVLSVKKQQHSVSSPALRQLASPRDQILDSPALRVRKSMRRTPAKFQLGEDEQSTPKMKDNIVTALNFQENDENQSPPQQQQETKSRKSISRIKPTAQTTTRQSFLKKPSGNTKIGPPQSQKSRLPPKNSDRYALPKKEVTRRQENVRTMYIEAELFHGEELIQPTVINVDHIDKNHCPTADKKPPQTSVAHKLPKPSSMAGKTSNLTSTASKLPKQGTLAGKKPVVSAPMERDQLQREASDLIQPQTINASKPRNRVSQKASKPLGSRIPSFGARRKVTDADAVLGLMRKKLATIKRRSVQAEVASVISSIEMTLSSVAEKVPEEDEAPIKQFDPNQTKEPPRTNTLPSAEENLPKPSIASDETSHGRSEPDVRSWKEVLSKESVSPTWRDILKKEKCPLKEKPHQRVAFWTAKTPCPQKNTKGVSTSECYPSKVAQAPVQPDWEKTEREKNELEILKAEEEARGIEEEMKRLELEKEKLRMQEEKAGKPPAPRPSLYKTDDQMTDISAIKDRIMKVLTSEIPPPTTRPKPLLPGPQKFFDPITSPEGTEKPQIATELATDVNRKKNIFSHSGLVKENSRNVGEVTEKESTQTLRFQQRKSVRFAENSSEPSPNLPKDDFSPNYPPKDSPNFIKPKSADCMTWNNFEKSAGHKISSGRIGGKIEKHGAGDTAPNNSDRCPIIPVVSPKMGSVTSKNSPIMKEKLIPNGFQQSPTMGDVFTGSPKWDPAFAELVKSPQFCRGAVKSSSSDGMSLSDIPDITLLGPSFYEKYGETKEELQQNARNFITSGSPILNYISPASRPTFGSKHGISKSPSGPDIKNPETRRILSPKLPKSFNTIEDMSQKVEKSPKIRDPFTTDNLELSALQSLRIVSLDYRKVLQPEKSDGDNNAAALRSPLEISREDKSTFDLRKVAQPMYLESSTESGEICSLGMKKRNGSSVCSRIVMQPEHGKLSQNEISSDSVGSFHPKLVTQPGDECPNGRGGRIASPQSLIEISRFDFSRNKSKDENGNFVSPVETRNQDKKENKNFPLGIDNKETRNPFLCKSEADDKETKLTSRSEKKDSLAVFLEGLGKGSQNKPAGFSTVPLKPVPTGGNQHDEDMAYGLRDVPLSIAEFGTSEANLLTPRSFLKSSSSIPCSSSTSYDSLDRELERILPDQAFGSVEDHQRMRSSAADFLPIIMASEDFKNLPKTNIDFSSVSLIPTPLKKLPTAVPLPDFGHFKPASKPAHNLPQKPLKATRHPSDLMNFSSGGESAGLVDEIASGKVFTFGKPVVNSSTALAAPKPIKPPPPETPTAFRLLRQRFRESPTPKKTRSRSPFSMQSPSRGVCKKTPQKKSRIQTSSPSIKSVCSRRFAEALLDEEVALFTCRNFRNVPVTPGRNRRKESASNPLARVLIEGDDKHFIPLSPIAQSRRPTKKTDAISGSAFSAFTQGT